MFPIALAFAESEGISDLLMIMMVGCGGVAGQQSPLASSGIVAKTLMSDIGLDNYTPAFLSVMLTAMIAAVLFYFFLKGHRLENKKIESKENIPLNNRQKITLAVIAVVLILIALFKYDVGLTAILGTGVLLLIGVADEKETLKNCPWGVYIMIGGVSLLVNLVNQAGGITKLSDYLASIMTPATAAPIMCLLGGLMSSVSSAVGVTMPTLIPTIPSIIERVGGNVSATVLASATIVGSLMVVFSPFSTLGGLAMYRLSRIPAVGDRFTAGGHLFEIVDMDGNRVDKLMIRVLPLQAPDGGATPAP
jgi:di/tricarboxylate transporter